MEAIVNRSGATGRTRACAVSKQEEGIATVMSLIVIVFIPDGCVTGRDAVHRRVIGDRAIP